MSKSGGGRRTVPHLPSVLVIGVVIAATLGALGEVAEADVSAATFAGRRNFANTGPFSRQPLIQALARIFRSCASNARRCRSPTTRSRRT